MHAFIARAARALCLSDLERDGSYLGLTSIEDVIQKRWQEYIPLVVAVMRAMLEPTAEMIVAAEEIVPALASDAIRRESPSYIAWQTMLKTALSHAEE